ncbi:hypothetical protein B0T14DRAFT_424237 [Immersiella caudata]|uniref:Uncharacterized protein n=1 Tax=Immersiella caudata TaxID=314043 RepID=A0AA39X2J3_9PEZI|nr:hypothetical protein B0T14DRAFT_424237 [Immersiella caudata]
MALGPRVPGGSLRRNVDMGSLTWALNVPSRIMGRAAESSCASANLCEKPVGGQSMTVAIALGVCIPLVAAFGALIYLHRRGVKKQRMEDAADPHKSLDFGLDPAATGGKSKRKSFLGREKDDKSRLQRQQMSMDMNLSSPYLLPPTMHNSRESLNSLARTIGGDADPYKPIAAYAASDAGSVRSMPMGPNTGSPPYARSNRGSYQRPLNSPLSPSFPPRQNSLPKSNLSSPEPVHAKPDAMISEEPLPLPPAKDTTQAMAPYPEESAFSIGTAIQEPPAAAQKVARKPALSPGQPSPADSGVDMGYENPFDEKKHLSEESTISSRQTAAGLGLVDQLDTTMQPSVRSSVESAKGPGATAAPQLGPIAMPTGPIIEEPTSFYDYGYGKEVEMPREPQQLQPVEEERGRNMQRQSHLYNQQQGLGVPSRDSRRLSVGFRPLPPDEIMETEDPEYRANRIRSFYKEYFEDINPSNAPPVPPMPAQHQNGYQQGNNQYYEDYSEGYAQDAPYFDPASNSFVMPYAQPVSRRAMTPPPSGQRFPGPRGPPRQMHGSMGGHRMPGPRGPPRPGSSVSNQRGPGSRPGSSMSSAYGRRRADSAMSGSRYGGGPKKPLPPPTDLHTLPTPSKLKDDSFALFNSMDFAPPESFQSRARGRSQSPLGERRAYKPAVPAHSPLVTPFEDLPVLPSPHTLRKSSTFTGLDFAPPRKFVDSDNRSDAGSIRSNRSGISAVQLGAIRNGAGRVSRLPGDTIFTQVAMQDKLKPQWGMRD